MQPPADQDQPLPRRLRALREETWPGHVVTQRELAHAFEASVPLISSWESLTTPRTPPASRIEAYARFFATKRSVSGGGDPRLLTLDELTDVEHTRYEDLIDELTALRSSALRLRTPSSTSATSPALRSF